MTVAETLGPTHWKPSVLRIRIRVHCNLAITSTQTLLHQRSPILRPRTIRRIRFIQCQLSSKPNSSIRFTSRVMPSTRSLLPMEVPSTVTTTTTTFTLSILQMFIPTILKTLISAAITMYTLLKCRTRTHCRQKPQQFQMVSSWLRKEPTNRLTRFWLTTTEQKILAPFRVIRLISLNEASKRIKRPRPGT